MIKKQLTFLCDCVILTELSQEYILNIQFKQFKNLKKLLTEDGKCDRVNELSERHGLPTSSGSVPDCPELAGGCRGDGKHRKELRKKLKKVLDRIWKM